MARAVVDLASCEGNAICVGLAFDVFQLNDDDVADVLVDELDEKQVQAVERAVMACPMQAITLED